MIKEYIEREALIELIENNSETKFDWSECVDIDVLRPAILDIPAADVAPVVHGEWIPIVNHFHGKPDGRYYCSECHRVETMKGIYCRLCGARMDGGNSNA